MRASTCSPDDVGRSTMAITGSPSVVAFLNPNDNDPVSNQSGPKASSSTGGNWSMCTDPATVPPLKPSFLAVASSWMLPWTPLARFSGVRTGPVM
jgi:hypothetical protein